MKLLFENWRKYITEEPLTKDEIENEIATASFNSAQSSQHRWSPRQPIIDYFYNKRVGSWSFTAYIPDGTDNADKWPVIRANSGENIKAFLTRIKETPHQLNLFENWRQYINEGDVYYVDAISEEDEYCPVCVAALEEEKKPCKPSKGKRFAKRVDGKCRSFGQAGQAKGGGDRIRPGTAKGDAYCARSAKIKKCKNPPCANTLSRKKWKCRGSKSVA
jgi:hypothetical protein